MKQGRRFGLSAEQNSDVWRCWKAGQTRHEIGCAFGNLLRQARHEIADKGLGNSEAPVALFGDIRAWFSELPYGRRERDSGTSIGKTCLLTSVTLQRDRYSGSSVSILGS